MDPEPRTLSFNVISWSSETLGREASNLNKLDQMNPGWQSAQFVFNLYDFFYFLFPFSLSKLFKIYIEIVNILKNL